MKKITLNELTEAVTGVKKDDYYWEDKKQSVRNIQRALKVVIGSHEITDLNKDKYVKIYKLMYNDDSIKSLINKQSRIIENIQREGTTLIIPNEFKKKKGNGQEIELPTNKYILSKEEHIRILEILLEFFGEGQIGYIIERNLIEFKSEEYNHILDEFEDEVRRIKMSIQGYPYEERVEKMKEIKEYLKVQRLEIDKNIMDNLILPE